MSRVIYSQSIVGVVEEVIGVFQDTDKRGLVIAAPCKVALMPEGTVPAITDFVDPDALQHPDADTARFSLFVGGANFNPPPGTYRVWVKVDTDPDKPGRPILSDTIEVV